MGTVRSPLPSRLTSSWIHSTIFFTLLSYQVLIPGCIPIQGSSLSGSPSPPSRESIVLFRDDPRPQPRIPRFRIPPKYLQINKNVPLWEVPSILRHVVLPPYDPRYSYHNRTDLLRRVLMFDKIMSESFRNQEIHVEDGTSDPMSDEDYRSNSEEWSRSRSNEILHKGEKHDDGKGIDVAAIFARNFPNPPGYNHFKDEKYGKDATFQDYLGGGLDTDNYDSFPDENSLSSDYDYDNPFDVDEIMSNSIPPPALQGHLHPRPLSSLRRFRQNFQFRFPLHQARYGFSRRPRAESVVKQFAVPRNPRSESGRDRKQVANSVMGESGESKRGVLAVWQRPPITSQDHPQFKAEGKHQKNPESILTPQPHPPSIFGHLTFRDHREHYKNDPLELLRKFIMEHDSTFFAKNEPIQDPQVSPLADKHISKVSGMGNIFLKTLVSRSGAGSGIPGNDDDSGDGDPVGQRGESGRKFQTQGW